MKVLPIYVEAGISGFESPAAEYKELKLSLEDLLLQHPNATFFGLANGRSMEGRGIFNGDVLVVDRAEKVTNGSVIVANYNGCFVCKIIDTEKALLLSASDEHKAIPITEADSFQIEGVVNVSFRLHKTISKLLSCLL
ncbi:MAG: S24 family peptidase [Alteromonadaceae bacterium TMED7]|nr:MAG: S24 family peptidase [Alteromonadaceae bacterium TMED7]|tara:strand:+ start:28574 stop:28987 length:414 start_codon:yes stop_codon:yes gene_type:complete